MVRQAKAQRMLTHDQIWGALDRLAAHAGLSPSGLAKRAGLDPTTFNKSKRITSDGRERWPSTESIAKALAAADCSMESFVRLIGDGAGDGRCVPLLSLAQAGASGAFDESGFPSGKGWTEIALPSAEDSHLLRWRSQVMRFNPPIATATSSWSRPARRSARATAWWRRCGRARW